VNVTGLRSPLRPDQLLFAGRYPTLTAGRVVDPPTNSIQRMPPAVDRFRTALAEGRISHDGDPDLTRHVLNGRLRKVGRDDDGRGLYTLEKAGPGRLIDALVACVLGLPRRRRRCRSPAGSTRSCEAAQEDRCDRLRAARDHTATTPAAHSTASTADTAAWLSQIGLGKRPLYIPVGW
jgi:hypothetical protein